MIYQQRRPVIKAVKYSTADNVRAFLDTIHAVLVSKVTEVVALGQYALQIELELREGKSTIDMKQGDYLVYTEELGLHSQSESEFVRLYEPMNEEEGRPKVTLGDLISYDTPDHSLVFVTAFHPQTKEQRAAAKAALQEQLPANVVVVLLDPGMSVEAFLRQQKQA